jgi:ABC-type sugar transport system ATPase subunit
MAETTLAKTSEGAPRLLRAEGVGKRFGPVVALSPTDFSVGAGEVRGLVGSNGAGKSTLIKVLTGAYRPSTGRILLNDRVMQLGNPHTMLRQGIACIYQHSTLISSLSVSDNIFLGRQPATRLGLVDRRRQRREVESLIADYRIEVDPSMRVGLLSTVKQKEVEILKALALRAQLIFMDEPTAWLSHSEVQKLHRTIIDLKARKVAIVYVSHVLDEVFRVCDSISIMRDGAIVWEGVTADIDRPKLVNLMVGEKLGKASLEAGAPARKPRGGGEIRLSCRGLSRRNVFFDVSFDLYAGEILCITGLVGAKRTEVAHGIFGSAPLDGGEVELCGRRARFRSPKDAISCGLGLVPEDRRRDGLLSAHSIADNLVLVALKTVTRFGVLDRIARLRLAMRQIENLGILPRNPTAIVAQLSGGNQQKVLIGKWLEAAPMVLVLDEPTVGIDVGAKAEIYAKLRALRDAGQAVLIISSDLEEVMAISDRIAVMVNGRLEAIHDAGVVSREQIVAEIGGD